MNTKLKPIAGALIVGLIGIAHAACYFEQSYVCLANGQGSGTYYNSGCQDSEISATSDWIGWNTFRCYDPDTDPDCGAWPGNSGQCQGPGRYYDWCTFQYAPFNPAVKYPTITWNRLDFNQTCSP